MPADDDRLSADLTSLADGTLSRRRRARLEAEIAGSPELGERLERQRRAVAALRSVEVRAPASLRARIEAERGASVRRAPAERERPAPGCAGPRWPGGSPRRRPSRCCSRSCCRAGRAGQASSRPPSWPRGRPRRRLPRTPRSPSCSTSGRRGWPSRAGPRSSDGPRPAGAWTRSTAAAPSPSSTRRRAARSPTRSSPASRSKRPTARGRPSARAPRCEAYARTGAWWSPGSAADTPASCRASESRRPPCWTSPPGTGKGAVRF